MIELTWCLSACAETLASITLEMQFFVSFHFVNWLDIRKYMRIQKNSIWFRMRTGLFEDIVAMVRISTMKWCGRTSDERNRRGCN